ncbi:tetraspanin-2-like [Aristolochia californica]|uniref:tetraspanin-2-like n=1 Tax=Aristolochia californica TaxID=171875 RepID=UPI0035DE14FF
MAVSNNITAVLNFFAFLCSLPIIGAGTWLASKQDNECIHAFKWPVVLLGVLVLLVSLAGFAGAYWNRKGLLAIYLFSMAVLIVLLIVLLIFAFIVTRQDGSYAVAGRNYKEYRLQGYSAWLRNYIQNSEHWAQIRSCLALSDVCPRLSRDFFTSDQFFVGDISPLQTGCCKPPTVCGYTYVNPTEWVNPVNSMADPDCNIWSNDQSMLCYNCSSCKAGLLGNLRKEWRKANTILIITLVALISVYLIACNAFKNAQTASLFRRYKYGYA